MPSFPPRTRKLVSPEGSACQNTNTTSARRLNSSHSGVSSIPPRAALKSFAFAWRAQCASLSDQTRSGRARADGRGKRARPTVIWRLRTGQPNADKAHPAPLARQIARKADVRLSSPRMVCWSEGSFLASFPAEGFLQGPRYLGRPRLLRKGTAGGNPNLPWLRGYLFVNSLHTHTRMASKR